MYIYVYICHQKVIEDGVLITIFPLSTPLLIPPSFSSPVNCFLSIFLSSFPFSFLLLSHPHNLQLGDRIMGQRAINENVLGFSHMYKLLAEFFARRK